MKDTYSRFCRERISAQRGNEAGPRDWWTRTCARKATVGPYCWQHDPEFYRTGKTQKQRQEELLWVRNNG